MRVEQFHGLIRFQPQGRAALPYLQSAQPAS